MFSIIPPQKPELNKIDRAVQCTTVEIIHDSCEKIEKFDRAVQCTEAKIMRDMRKKVEKPFKTDKDIRAEMFEEWERVTNELLGLSEE